jgi:hypothetical protein
MRCAADTTGFVQPLKHAGEFNGARLNGGPALSKNEEIAKMKRTLVLAFALVVGLAQLASAATVVVTASDTTPSPGQTITLELRGTVAPADGTDTSLFGAIVYPSTAFIAAPTPGTQTAFTPMWAPGPLTCNTSRCVMFSQTAGLNGPQSGNATNQLITTQNFTILASTPIGTVLEWRWQTSPSTQTVDFWNFQNAQAPVPALSVTVVPEPTTAAMLGLGMLGLALAGRRRS